MMVKPADADGDAEMNVGASTDAIVEPAVERETSNEEEEEEDAMDALLGVGREIGDDDAHGRDDRAADDDAPAAGDAGDDDEDMDEDDTAEGSPERCARAPPSPARTRHRARRPAASSPRVAPASNAFFGAPPPLPALPPPPPAAGNPGRADDMDESARLHVLGELGGDEEDDLAATRPTTTSGCRPRIAVEAKTERPPRTGAWAREATARWPRRSRGPSASGSRPRARRG